MGLSKYRTARETRSLSLCKEHRWSIHRSTSFFNASTLLNFWCNCRRTGNCSDLSRRWTVRTSRCKYAAICFHPSKRSRGSEVIGLVLCKGVRRATVRCHVVAHTHTWGKVRQIHSVAQCRLSSSHCTSIFFANHGPTRSLTGAFDDELFSLALLLVTGS